MTRPTTYLIRMLVFLVAVGVVVAVLSPVLIHIFDNNPVLNSLILLILLIGIIWNLRQVMRLSPEVTWLETFQTARNRLAAVPTPRLLAPMASMLAAREQHGRNGQAGRFTLSATSFEFGAPLGLDLTVAGDLHVTVEAEYMRRIFNSLSTDPPTGFPTAFPRTLNLSGLSWSLGVQLPLR